MHCPHCESPVTPPPPSWATIPPWPCSACGGLFGVLADEIYSVPPLAPLWPLMTAPQARAYCHFIANRPYVYAICHPNGLPFYIGKGRVERMFAHAHFLITEPTNDLLFCKTRKEEELLKLLLSKHQERYAILAECDTDKEAFAIESHYIKQWGQRPHGPLTNVTLVPINLPVVIPRPPVYEFDDEVPTDDTLWALHPRVNERAGPYVTYVYCDNCHRKCRTNLSRHLDGARCPRCFHYFKIDGHKLTEEHFAKIKSESTQKVPATR